MPFQGFEPSTERHHEVAATKLFSVLVLLPTFYDGIGVFRRNSELPTCAEPKPQTSYVETFRVELSYQSCSNKAY